MSFKGIHSVYFLGIGGIGMSALARWFAYEGYDVSGYDRTASVLTDTLISEGISIDFEDQIGKIPEKILQAPEKALIIWTPAMPGASPQLNYFRENGFTLKKRSVVLGEITESYYTIAVAGTHGKTTTSSMIAHLFKFSKLPVTAFLGGITQNYHTNVILSRMKNKDSIVVVEADEFDRSFLTLHPNEVVLTSADPDHLDIYGDESSILEGFRQFVGLLRKKGKLYIQANASQRLGDLDLPKVKKKEYGLRSEGIRAENIRARRDSFVFDYVDQKRIIKDLEIFIPGYHNVENAIAAIAVALNHKISEENIREALKTFRGVKRRFEIHLNEANTVFIDDYAHHPEEIRSLLSSVRAMYPSRSLTVIFQPHLFTRTRDFAKDFSESLSLADQVLLLDIYPAREEPIAGVSSEMLLADIDAGSKILISKDELIDQLGKMEIEVLVTLGAGDIDRMVPEIENWLKSRKTISEL